MSGPEGSSSLGSDMGRWADFPIALSDRHEPSEHVAVRIPTFTQLARRGGPQILEGALIPLGLFLLAMKVAGLASAIIVGLGWEVVVVCRRLVLRRPIPGIMMVGAALLFVRSTLALATGSAFLYFVQPAVGTACVASAFLLSVVVHRPLARRFAGDFLDIPTEVHADARVSSYFQRCSMMWAGVGFTNAAVTLWLLLSQSTATYLAAKTALSITLTIGTVIASVVWFRRTMVRTGRITVLSAGRLPQRETEDDHHTTLWSDPLHFPQCRHHRRARSQERPSHIGPQLEADGSVALARSQ